MPISVIALSSMLITGQLEPGWPPSPQGLEASLPVGSSYHASYAATTEDNLVVTFFSFTPESGVSKWFARRQQLRQNDKQETSWAAASSCPALYAALDWLTNIQPPRLAINGLRQLPEDSQPYAMGSVRGPVADGPSYWISGSGWGPDRSLVTVSFQSTGGYVVDWGEETTRHMLDCWNSDLPAELK